LQADPPRLYHLPEYGPLAHLLREAATLDPGTWGMARFANGELSIELSEAPALACLVLASLAPPDERMTETLLLCHTLRKEGAGDISLLAPYLAYTRAERDEPRRSRATAWVGALLAASGVSRVVTIDVHNPQVAALCPLPLVSLSPARLFAEAILRFAWQDATIVAADAGARDRAVAVRAAAGMPAPLAVMAKTRTATGVTGELQGSVGQRAVIVDDILDTGGTLIACARALRHAGVDDIMVCVSHPLFSGVDWPRLWDHGVTRLICLDTVPAEAARLDDRIHILRCASLLADGIRA
jgi:ribose-phosphate pyrophosphokinase